MRLCRVAAARDTYSFLREPRAEAIDGARFLLFPSSFGLAASNSIYVTQERGEGEEKEKCVFEVKAAAAEEEEKQPRTGDTSPRLLRRCCYF